MASVSFFLSDASPAATPFLARLLVSQSFFCAVFLYALTPRQSLHLDAYGQLRYTTSTFYLSKHCSSAPIRLPLRSTIMSCSQSSANESLCTDANVFLLVATASASTTPMLILNTSSIDFIDLCSSPDPQMSLVAATASSLIQSLPLFVSSSVLLNNLCCTLSTSFALELSVYDREWPPG